MSIATRPLGSTGLEQIDGWVQAPDVRLSARDLEDVTRAVEQTDVGGGSIDVLATVG